MKKRLSIFTMVSLLLMSIFLGSFNMFAWADDQIVLYKDLSWEVRNSKHLVEASETEYKATVSVSEPIERVNGKGQTEYLKKVEVKNDVFLAGTRDYISGNLLNIYFQYDNNTVKLENNGFIETPIYNDKLWKTSSSGEVYMNSQQCIVSEKINVYKRESTQKNWMDSDEYHIDVICTPAGEVSFNIESLDKDNILKKNIVTNKKTNIKKGLDRVVIETNKENAKDLTDDTKDKYRYITREMHIMYKNEKGNLLADTIIEAHFRYNKDTNEVQCLSTLHKEQFGRLKVYTQTGNETKTYGGAYGEINLKYSSGCNASSYDESIIIKCDSKGNITSQII